MYNSSQYKIRVDGIFIPVTIGLQAVYGLSENKFHIYFFLQPF